MPVQVSYPGVYIQEVSSGVHHIATASTSTAAFVGETERGPDDDAKRITNWTEYQKYYGGFVGEEKNYLAHSVYQFLKNGGQQCYIVRATCGDAAKADVIVCNIAKAREFEAGEAFEEAKTEATNAKTVIEGRDQVSSDITDEKEAVTKTNKDLEDKKITTQGNPTPLANAINAISLADAITAITSLPSMSATTTAIGKIDTLIGNLATVIKEAQKVSTSQLEATAATEAANVVKQALTDLLVKQLINEAITKTGNAVTDISTLSTALTNTKDAFENFRLAKENLEAIQSKTDEQTKLLSVVKTAEKALKASLDKIQIAIDAKARSKESTTQKVDQAVKFSAKNKGAWGNYLYLQIENGSHNPTNEFKISIRQQIDAALIPEGWQNIPAKEVHDNLSMNPKASNYVVNVLEQKSNLIDAEVLTANHITQDGVYRSAPFTFSTALEEKVKFHININNDGWQTVDLSTVKANTNIEAIRAEIQTKVCALTKLKNSTDENAFTSFTCTKEDVSETGDSGAVTKYRLILKSGTASVDSSIRVQDFAVEPENAAPLLGLGQGDGGVFEDGLTIRRPANADIVEIGDNAIRGVVSAVTPGKNGDEKLREIDYQEQLNLLDNKTDFSLLAIPGIGTSAMFDLGVAYCENRPLRDVFYIGEMPAAQQSPEEAEKFRGKLTKPNSYGALYYPWIKSLDISGQSDTAISLPPSGFAAGLYARIDSNRGVWKAPAGTEATISGAVSLVKNLTDIEQGNLNNRHVNCFRQFADAGIVSWGARTICPPGNEYNYVPVRRTAIMLRVSIYKGLQWAVFEPNDEELWGQIRLNLNSFMMTLFRQGAFQGSSPSKAFFVKCDGETTTQDDINAGIVNVLVGFAPLKPAEFIVVQIRQKAGQSS
jgi:phage tail sheath protein FI